MSPPTVVIGSKDDQTSNIFEGRRVALLVIDVQEAFRHMITEHMINEVNDTIKLFRENQLPVVWTQHGHRYPKDDTGELGVWWPKLSEIGDESWQILPEFTERVPSDFMIDEKRRYDAFLNTPLDFILRSNKVDTVVVCGVVTNLCVETTARSAFCRDYRVTVLSDGCGASTPEYHEAALSNLAYGFGRVMTCAEARDMLKKKVAHPGYSNNEIVNMSPPTVLIGSKDDQTSNIFEGRRVALLVIDVQEAFRPMITEHMINEVSDTIKWFRQKQKLPVIGDESWHILPEFTERVRSDFMIDEKRRYDAFLNTPLDFILRSNKVDTVVVCGVVTNLCVETTARSAFCRDYRVTVLSDGCGANTPENHEASLTNLAFGFGRVMTCAEARGMLKKQV